MLFVFRHDFSPVFEMVVVKISGLSSHDDVASTVMRLVPLRDLNKLEVAVCAVRDSALREEESTFLRAAIWVWGRRCSFLHRWAI